MRSTFKSLVTMVCLTGLMAATLDAQSQQNQSSAPRLPVLIELFTSEGCSDCPPADALLERLDRSQPVDNAELIVLSEHVDYWNHLGWSDPYSSSSYSERQSAYAAQFGLGSAYTPQMVVDGRFQFVGSDERRAIMAVESAIKSEKIAVSLSSVRLESNHRLFLHVDAGQLPEAGTAKSANIFLAIADERDESHVSAGENGGRTLKHVAVVRNLAKVGTLDRSDRFSKDLSVKVNHGSGNMRVVTFVQETKTGRIWGVGSARVSE